MWSSSFRFPRPSVAIAAVRGSLLGAVMICFAAVWTKPSQAVPVLGTQGSWCGALRTCQDEEFRTGWGGPMAVLNQQNEERKE